jgi:hypothetical protein
MRLQPEEAEIAAQVRGRNAGIGGDRAHAPIRGPALGPRLERSVDKVGHALVANRGRHTGKKFAMQALDALRDESRAPLAHSCIDQIERHSNGTVRFAIGRCQHDLGTHLQRRGQRRRGSHCAELRALGLGNHQFSLRAPPISMAISPLGKIPETKQLLCHKLAKGDTS